MEVVGIQINCQEEENERHDPNPYDIGVGKANVINFFIN